MIGGVGICDRVGRGRVCRYPHLAVEHHLCHLCLCFHVGRGLRTNYGSRGGA